MKRAGVGYLKMVIVHGHGNSAARNSVVAVAQRVRERLAGGPGRIKWLILTDHLAGNDPSRNWHVIHEKGLSPAQKRECVSPVLPVVQEVGKPIQTAKAGEPEAELRIERLESVTLSIQGDGRVKQLVFANELQATKD